jgi:ketosteroid isomerase-like protein
VSQDNVDLVRGGYEDAKRGDVEGLLARWHPEVVVDDPTRPNPSSPEGLYRGHEDVRRYFEDWDESFEETRHEPEEFIDAGDRLVVRVHSRARGRGSGVEIENDRYHVFTFREGLVESFTVVATRAEALDAGSRD